MKKDHQTQAKPGKMKRLAIGCLLWLVLLLIVAGIVALVVMEKKKPEEEAEPETVEERSTPVKTMKLEPRRIPDIIFIPGRLDPSVEVALSTEKPARIVKMYADEGDRVTAGQVLLQLDDRMWQQAKQRAEIELADAERDQQRWKELEAAGAVAGSEYEDLTDRRDTARVAKSEAEIVLSQMVIKSPIDGVVEERRTEPGAYAMEGMHVFTVVDIDPLTLTFDVPERDILYIEQGDHITFSVSTHPDQLFTGEVSFVSSRANRENNAFRIEARVANADGIMKAGMITRVQLIRSYREEALAVPLACVVPDGGDHVVFTVEDNRARRNTVILDGLLDSEAVISDGLRPGDQVVVEGHRALADGALVIIQE